VVDVERIVSFLVLIICMHQALSVMAPGGVMLGGKL